MKKLRFFKYLILPVVLSLLLLTSCEKDDTDIEIKSETTDIYLQQEATKVSIKEIPKIQDFLSTLNNGRSTFQIDKSYYNNETRSSEPDLVIGQLQTTEIVKVSDGMRHNYTFLLKTIDSNDTTSKSIFNLVVLENYQGLFSYITEYRPTNIWFESYKQNNNFNTFTGDILYFTIEGAYIAKATLVSGNVTSSETRNPCDSDGNNGDGGNGGNGDAGGDSGDGGNTGNGPPGGNIDIITITIVCGCYEHEGGGASCDCDPDMDVTIIEIKATDETKNNFLRDPCNEVPNQCFHENTDPCPCNITGDGCADVDDDEPIGTGVLLDLNALFLANDIVESINDDNLIECQRQILDQLKMLNNHDLARVLSRFDPTEMYNLEIKTETLGAGNYGLTNWKSTNNGNAIPYNYFIKISDIPANSTDLHLAATLFHELVHALFLSYADDLLQTGNSQLEEDFPALWDWYVLERYGGNANNVQHEVLAEIYVDSIARSLQEFHTGMAVANDETPQELYSDIAWGGLENTTVFNDAHPNGSESRTRIDNRVFIEAFNVEIGDQSPAGSNACN